MTKFIANLRYGAYIAVFFSFVSAALMLIVGCMKIIKAIYGYATNTGTVIFKGTEHELIMRHLTEEDVAIARVIESMDAFLIALVMLYLGYGMYSLFCEKKKGDLLKQLPSSSIVPKNIGQLKETLSQLIIVILFVLFTRQIWLHLDDLSWEILILPLGILLLSLSVKFTEFSKGHE